MLLSGFADEAAADIDGQIRATTTLGWRWIEARMVGDRNIHDLSDAEFEMVYGKLSDAGIGVHCFGSAIANWAKDITKPFAPCLEEAKRALPRMQRLGTRLIRIMSYPVLKEREPDDQFEGERFKRLRTLVKLFADVGIQALHENCSNYGGMGWSYTQRLLDHVRGLKLVFDTGNPLHSDDLAKPCSADGRRQKQSSWEFYERVRDHVAHVHIKDARWEADGTRCIHTFPGEGQGEVRRIIADLRARGYDGALSIEPHLAVQAHDPSITAPADTRFANYVEYGRRLERLLATL